MSKKDNRTSKSSRTTDDKVIADLIEQRRLQQEALIKIMTSMDKNTGLPETEQDGQRKKSPFSSKKSN